MQYRRSYVTALSHWQRIDPFRALYRRDRMKSASLRKVTEILIKITIVAINVTVHQGGVSSNEKRCGTVGFWECETVEDHHKHHFRAFQSQP